MLGMDGFDPSTVRRCGANWSGTSTCTHILAGTADAQVTWVLDPSDNPVVLQAFHAEGTVRLRSAAWPVNPECMVSPTSAVIDSAGDGDLRFLTDGTSVEYQGQGGSHWVVAVTCPPPGGSGDLVYVVPWFVAVPTPFVPGANEISGSYSDAALSCSYHFTR
jgi:hypothetical protein